MLTILAMKVRLYVCPLSMPCNPQTICGPGHRYTTYEILVAKRGKVQADEEKCWAVSKRYSDFVALR